jgi:hypothetical protein
MLQAGPGFEFQVVDSKLLPPRHGKSETLAVTVRARKAPAGREDNIGRLVACYFRTSGDGRYFLAKFLSAIGVEPMNGMTITDSALKGKNFMADAVHVAKRTGATETIYVNLRNLRAVPQTTPPPPLTWSDRADTTPHPPAAIRAEECGPAYCEVCGETDHREDGHDAWVAHFIEPPCDLCGKRGHRENVHIP